jgi:hypothetical protein
MRRRHPSTGDPAGAVPLVKRIPGATLARLVESDMDPDRAASLVKPVSPPEALRSILEFDIDLDHLMRSGSRTARVRDGRDIRSPDTGGEFGG